MLALERKQLVALVAAILAAGKGSGFGLTVVLDAEEIVGEAEAQDAKRTMDRDIWGS